jgi:DNA-directed RNA polymerase I, II, and III subunit RPABC5
MPVPIRCFTCGKPLADKKSFYDREVKSRYMKKNKVEIDNKKDKVITITSTNIEKQIEGQILDELGLIRQCCRNSMMTYLDN